MLKLTRLDHRTVAINPDHIAWVEATPVLRADELAVVGAAVVPPPRRSMATFWTVYAVVLLAVSAVFVFTIPETKGKDLTL